jgi:hypothetical protein
MPKLGIVETITVFVSPTDADAEAGTGAVQFRINEDWNVIAVGAHAMVAPTGQAATFDINDDGTTILSTIITIDASTVDSSAAVTPPVISSSTIAAGSEISIDIDQVGSTAKGQGFSIYMQIVRAG